MNRTAGTVRYSRFGLPHTCASYGVDGDLRDTDTRADLLSLDERTPQKAIVERVSDQCFNVRTTGRRARNLIPIVFADGGSGDELGHSPA